MAVVKQNFVTVRTDTVNLDRIVGCLVSEAEFVSEEPSVTGKNIGRAVAPTEGNPYLAMKEKLNSLVAEINTIGKSVGKQGQNKGNVAATVKADEPEEMSAYIEQCAGKLAELSHTCDSVKRAVDEDKKILEQLLHFKGLDVPMEELFSFEFFKIRLGYLPAENYEKMKLYTSNMKSVIFTPLSEEKDYVWGTYIVIARHEDEVDSAFEALNFKRMRISERVKGKPEEAYSAFSKELEEIEASYADTKRSLIEYAESIGSEIPAFSEELDRMSAAFELKKKTVLTSGVCTVYGWIPEKLCAKLKSKLSESGAELTAQEPSEVEAEPPVKLRNPKLFRPFESFVNMYGTPAYNELDPTVIFALTYSLFFGLMFGDVGQGAVLFIGGLLLYLWKKIDLAGIIAFVGVFSMAGGFLYGSVFGNEELIQGIFVPTHNINGTLFGAVGIGVAMIVICVILNIINGIKQKKIDKYLLSPNGLVGLVFYICALVAALAMFGMIESKIPSNVLITIIAVCAVLLFIREPLAKLIERRHDWLPESIGESFAENFFELFEVVLSYVTNTISFIRIGAFALSHAGMMTVVYLLAQTASGGHNPVILIIGNAVVIGIEGMIVCIQVLRLEFYELFSRFYTGDGRNISEE